MSTDQIESSARRTKFVQRASKITGKLFLALVTFGRWSAAKTTVAQLAAKAAQLDVSVDITPEALQQRMTVRAVAFLQDLLRTAFAKLHTGDAICEEGIFAPFPRVHIADSTGFCLPESLAKEFPGAGGSGSTAGAKIQLVWEYKQSVFTHFALIPWNIPDQKYIDTVVALAQNDDLFLFDLGYFSFSFFDTLTEHGLWWISRYRAGTTYQLAATLYRQDEVLDALGIREQPLLDLAMELERIALQDEYFAQRKLFPNVDFYSGILYKAMGFPTAMFTAMFAVARTVGWIAQWNEMIEDPSQKIGRPRQLYTGYTQRTFLPLHQRA